MIKRYFSLRWLLLVMLLLCCLAGCGKKEQRKRENVTLTVWAPKTETEMTKTAVQQFIEVHKKQADLHIEVETKELEEAQEAILDNPKAGADIFPFASDQFVNFKKNKILAPITYQPEKVMNAAGGASSAIVDTVRDMGTLYAFPCTASNGYFLYYNAEYFKESDVNSLDRMLDIAAEHNKCIAMDWSSGWYLYSFFSGADMDVEIGPDGKHNTCNFNRTNGTYTGADVVNSLLDIVKHPGFRSIDSDSLLWSVAQREVIAAVNGTWNSKNFEELWGSDFRATKLPSYTIKGKQVQMGSFAGYKYLGVNRYSKQRDWSCRLGYWLTNYKYQMLRYKTTGECPANLEAAGTDEVQSSASIAALNMQNQYANTQNVLESYWEPMKKFGQRLTKGKLPEKDIQKLLDDTVAEIQK